MATKITDEDIKQINILYKKLKTYSGVAREMGIAPTTVKKYILPDFNEEENKSARESYINIAPKPVEEIAPILSNEDMYNATMLTQEERQNMIKLWKELLF